MMANALHDWRLTIPEARAVQERLAGMVSREDVLDVPRLIAGVDISVNRAAGTATAAAVVLDFPGLALVEARVLSGRLDFPYVPGYLTFREAPLVLAACELLQTAPDLLMVDGQGISHPRRFGLASHLGVLLDIPTIGCAKSRLCGSHDEPEEVRGSYANLTHDGEVIGVSLRTRTGVRPIYVSIGHKVSLDRAMRWTLASCRGYRGPEPARQAHLAAGGNLKQSRLQIAAG